MEGYAFPEPHDENPVLDEFYKRGFLKLPTSVPQDMLDKVANAIRDIPIPNAVLDGALPQLIFGLKASGEGVFADSGSVPVVIVYFHDGFMNVSFHAKYINDCTHFPEMIGKYPPNEKGMLRRINDLETTFRVPEENSVNGVEKIARDAANKFKSSIDEIDQVLTGVADVLTHLNVFQYVNLGPYSQGTVLSVTRYFSPEARTFYLGEADGLHRDDFSRSLVGSINTGTRTNRFTAGRTEEVLETGTQAPGETVIIDDEDHRMGSRPNPLHEFSSDEVDRADESVEPEGRTSMLFILHRLDKTKFERERISNFGNEGLWTPTPVSERLYIAGAQRTQAPEAGR